MALLARLPKSWTPWYLGLFPERLKANVRIGSFVSQERQADYARDQRRIAADLRSVNFEAFDGSLLARLRALAGLPYQLELQLDATKGGVGNTIGVDLTLAMHSTARVREAFAKGGRCRASMHAARIVGCMRWPLAARDVFVAWPYGPFAERDTEKDDAAHELSAIVY